MTPGNEFRVPHTIRGVPIISISDGAGVTGQKSASTSIRDSGIAKEFSRHWIVKTDSIYAYCKKL